MVSDMNNGHGPRDVSQVAASVSHQRKFIIQDKDQLKFCYDTVLYYAQDLLMRRKCSLLQIPKKVFFNILRGKN